MQIQINPGDVDTSPAIDERIEKAVEHAMRHVKDRITRIEVHLHDENGPKHGNDKRCTMEARIAGKDPIAVHHDAPDLYAAIEGAAGKLERAVTHKLERTAQH